jgi:hypothetical protein
MATVSDGSGLWYDVLMIHLSPKAEALARRLAEAQSLSIEDAVTRALEASVASAAPSRLPPHDDSPTAVAARRKRIEQIICEVAAMPVLDRRSPREIMDDLNGG